MGMMILAIPTTRSKLDQKVIFTNKQTVEAIPITTFMKLSLKKKIEATRYFDYSYLLKVEKR
tara:strand:+ start:135 stop:320 length:186 start_codon:yes stop_codon:yes gene_type:complete